MFSLVKKYIYIGSYTEKYHSNLDLLNSGVWQCETSDRNVYLFFANVKASIFVVVVVVVVENTSAKPSCISSMEFLWILPFGQPLKNNNGGTEN